MGIRYMKNKDGFTLIELMSVVAIIGFLVVMGIPAWNNMIPHFRLKTAAREVSNMAHQARMKAVSINYYTEMVVDYNKDQIKWRELPSGEWNTVADKWKDVDVFEPADDTSIIGSGSDKTYPFIDDHVLFRPDGTAIMTGKERVAVYMQNKRGDQKEKFRVKITSSGTIKVQTRTTGFDWR